MTMTNELKPVNCGCGGEAVVYVTHWWGKCYVCQCDDCGMSTKPCDTEAEAIEAWNKAMGGNDIDVPAKERTAKVKTVEKPNVYKCSECGQYFHSTAWGSPVEYCSRCGARLEWE